MSATIACSVVVAARGAEANIPAILDGLRPDMSPSSEILVVFNEGVPLPRLPETPGLRLIRGARDAPIPELWRDGILAAEGRLVGFLTAHCIPDRGWLARLCDTDLDGVAAVGGRIIEPDDAGGVSHAIYCLRYPHASGTEPGPVDDVAADNSLYDRDEVLLCRDLLEDGFWEPAYHARFKARGKRLEFDPAMSATHVNRYGAGDFMAMRRQHGRAFALERVAGRGRAVRLLAFLLSPLVFPVFAVKATGRVLARPDLRGLFLRSFFWFYLFLANWSLGEISGYARAALARQVEQAGRKR